MFTVIGFMLGGDVPRFLAPQPSAAATQPNHYSAHLDTAVPARNRSGRK